MVGQCLVGLSGSPAKRNLHLPALRDFFDRIVNRHICPITPSSSLKGVEEQVIEGKTPEPGDVHGTPSSLEQIANGNSGTRYPSPLVELGMRPRNSGVNAAEFER
jgi:hypothetical protein